jgi:hypothetical protein
MSESSTESSSSGGSDESGGITDDQLPDDLNPEKNPLARDPEDDPDGPEGAGAPGGDAAPDAGS